MVIKSKEIEDIVNSYSNKITIATLGSHSALQILKGAKDEGFKTLAICEKGRDVPYKRFKVADEIVTLNSFKDILNEKVIRQLREKNALLVPHGSLIAHVGIDGIENNLNLPIIGNRKILRWEADRNLERKWLENAGLKMPKEISNPKKINKLSIVKFPGAKGGKGYFLANNHSEFIKKLRILKNNNQITSYDAEHATIQEYIIGVNMYLSYFYSPLNDEVEFFSIDRRCESNIDGLTRIPASDQINTLIEPSYVVVGNSPLVVRESLLSKIFEMGDQLVNVSKDIIPPGMIGAFCLETIVDETLDFITFELSARIVAGTNPFTGGSPYSRIMYDPGMSMGRRIAREVKNAFKTKKQMKIIT
jgi:5-formaminoimidazole-4-carboxamide-1-(beta)-D-ribofuranosyl 5'-monophosphate synthetase